MSEISAYHAYSWCILNNCFFFFRKWLDSNTKTAKERTESQQIVRDDLKKLEKRLKSNLQLNDIRYDCAWNVEHIRGCLKSLDHLHKMHTNELNCLQGKS